MKMHLGVTYAARRAGFGPGARPPAAQSPAGVGPAADERSRIAAIVGSPEAKGREQIANHLAFKTNLSVQQAIASLKAAAAGPSPLPTPASRGADNNPLGALDAAIDRQIAKHRPAPLSADAAQRALLEDEFRQSGADTPDAALDKAIGRQLLKQSGVAKAAEYAGRNEGR